MINQALSRKISRCEVSVAFGSKAADQLMKGLDEVITLQIDDVEAWTKKVSIAQKEYHFMDITFWISPFPKRSLRTSLICLLTIQHMQ